MHPRTRKLLLTTTALLALARLALTPVAAGPAGGTVVGGSATIQGAGTSNVTITQTSPSAIINWTTFNIGVGQTTTFNQPSSSSVVLNRVTGGLGPSEILGTLTANGRVFIINRDGILFGPGAVVNTAGFVATTHDIKNQDFMAGRYNFNIPGRPDASIVNQGTITATSGGFAALVAPGVRNSGTITATLGTVALGAANGFTLDLYGDRLITLAVNDQIAASVKDVATGKPLKSLITNDGKIRANGGRVELTAAAARTVVDSVINTSGVIKANSIGTRNGMIVLSAGTAATKPAGAPTQVVRVSGTLSAAGNKKGTKGGTIVVTGEDIKVAGAKIDASGRAGGGKVLIGGDWGGGKPDTSLVSNQSAKLEGFAIPTATTVSVDAATTINASARDRGDGGKVVLWSDSQTTFAGTILARGGESGGNGGFVETSSKQSLTVDGVVDLAAPRGRQGTWLLDPANLTIDNVAGPGVVTAGSIQTGLLTGDVLVATGTTGLGDGDINVASGVNLSWATNYTLTLSAYRNITLASGAVISNTGAGNLILRANSTGNPGTTAGDVAMFSGGINFSGSTGTVSIYHNPLAGYAFPTYPYDYATLTTTNPSVINQVRVYSLVNDATEFAAIGASPTTLGGTYALGRSFSLTGFGGFATGTTFTGTFDGNGGLGTNYTLSNLTLSSSSSPIGLFPFLSAGATVRNLNLSNVSITATGSTNIIGTVAGVSSGTISNVSVAGTVNGGANSGIIAGGLVGQVQSGGSISQSTAAVNVTTGDASAGFIMNTAGGLVGVVQSGGSISQSSSSGTVTTGINTFAGGLVGRNDGTITNSSSSSTVSGASGNGFYDIGSAIGGLAGFNSGTISGSFATGNLSGTSPLGAQYAMIVGGLVGLNNSPGQIINSYASGAVTGSGQVELGGLVGGNFSAISGSYAIGPVSGSGNGTIGGLVGFNSGGTIASSYASGPVTGSTGNVSVGGLVGTSDSLSSITNSYATGAVSISAPGAADQAAGGLVGANEGQITGSHATGPVTSNGGDVLIGGLVGGNTGDISNSFATGNVTATNAATALAGGLVGLHFGGDIFQSYATGNVDVSGAFGIAGGFVGFNNAWINQVFSTGKVTGTATDSLLGGLAGVNADNGTIIQAYATGPVTGNANSGIGGLVAVNTGSIDQTYAIGQLTGGGIVGGLVAANSSAPFPALSGHPDLGPLVTGTGTATNSYWDTQSTGQSSSAAGTGLTTAQLTNGLPPGFDANVWAIQANQSYAYFGWQPAGTTPRTDAVAPDLQPSPQPQIIQNLVGNTQFAALNTDQVVTITLPPPPPPGSPRQGPAPTNPYLPPGFSERIFDIPPITETRLIKDEVLLQIATIVTIDRLQDAVRQFSLSMIEFQSLGTTGSIALRFRITNGQTVQEIIRQLASVQIIAVAQPIYVYELAQQPPADPTPASRGNPGQQGVDQYVIEKLKLADVHRAVKGTNVTIAVIDSEIDAAHPDLQGVIAQRFSAVGAPEKPHAHGTGMAGAIGSHQKVLGVAPGARLMAVHAFSTSAAKAESTTYQILKGLDWSVSQGVRIVNMSFAGPKDPSLERSIKAAYDKGIVLIAAAGNAGPTSPPLYPGADPNVIAVTATDVDDKLFTGANRGKYVAVAAPGVDILVPAPDGAYQLTTGTSVAAAEVSGIVALLLERNPNLKPADIRRILTTSAKRLGPGERDDEFGSGLVDPLKAILLADPRTVSRTPAPPPPLRQR